MESNLEEKINSLSSIAARAINNNDKNLAYECLTALGDIGNHAQNIGKEDIANLTVDAIDNVIRLSLKDGDTTLLYRFKKHVESMIKVGK